MGRWFFQYLATIAGCLAVLANGVSNLLSWFSLWPPCSTSIHHICCFSLACVEEKIRMLAIAYICLSSKTVPSINILLCILCMFNYPMGWREYKCHLHLSKTSGQIKIDGPCKLHQQFCIQHGRICLAFKKRTLGLMDVIHLSAASNSIKSVGPPTAFVSPGSAFVPSYSQGP